MKKKQSEEKSEEGSDESIISEEGDQAKKGTRRQGKPKESKRGPKGQFAKKGKEEAKKVSKNQFEMKPEDFPELSSPEKMEKQKPVKKGKDQDQEEEKSIRKDEEELEAFEKLGDRGLETNAPDQMNETLRDTTILIDEIDRKTVLPEVKDPRAKEIPKDVDDFIYTNGKIDKPKLHTLMSQMTNDDILELFGAKNLNVYLALKKAYEAKVKQLNDARKENDPEIKVSAGKFRKILLDLPAVQMKFRKADDLKKKAFGVLVAKFKKQNKKMRDHKEELKAKRQAAKLTSKPKRKFVGALLAKLTPEQYREAMQDFNDAEKGKGLHKYASMTPGRMIKDLERRAYADEKNDAVAKVLSDPDAYKADDISAGMKRRLKDIQTRLAGKTDEQKMNDPEYAKFVAPYMKYRLDETALISDVRALIAKGKAKPEELKQKLGV